MVEITFYNNISVKLSFSIVIFFFPLTFPHKQTKENNSFSISFLSFSFHPNILVENKNPLKFFSLNFFPLIFFPLPNTPLACQVSFWRYLFLENHHSTNKLVLRQVFGLFVIHQSDGQTKKARVSPIEGEEDEAGGALGSRPKRVTKRPSDWNDYKHDF